MGATGLSEEEVFMVDNFFNNIKLRFRDEQDILP